MAFERKRVEARRPEPVAIEPPSESSAKKTVVLPTDGLLSDFLMACDIGFVTIPGHQAVYSKFEFSHTCDLLIAGGMRQIRGDHNSCQYEGAGRVIKVTKEKVMAKVGNGFGYVDRVTIN